MRLSITLLVILSICTTCIEPYNPKISGSNTRLLVVEGMISDQPGVHHVRLSYTRNINETIPLTATGAIVSIEDDAGNIFPLTETTTDGLYASDPSLQGVVGRSYSVRILIDDKEYISEPELMTPGAPISSITASFENEVILKGTSTLAQDVVLFFIDVENEDGASDYYKYAWDATYKIISPFSGNPDSCTATIGTVLPQWCYLNDQSSAFINVLSMEKYKGQVYQQHYFSYVNPNIKFMSRYSLNVKQYSITKRAFQYWENIKKQSENGSSYLFDPIPSRIVGNIKSVTNPDVIALGYFMASSVQAKREFFSQSIVTSPPPHFNTCDCFPYYAGCGEGDERETFCCDCSQYPGAFTEKPSFWID
jgi:hypothetical protein